jgi:hypothetical protein
MQSWAGFYSGNVQAPSLPPSVFGYAQNGALGGDPFALMNDPQAVINFATKGSAVHVRSANQLAFARPKRLLRLQCENLLNSRNQFLSSV